MAPMKAAAAAVLSLGPASTVQDVKNPQAMPRWAQASTAARSRVASGLEGSRACFSQARARATAARQRRAAGAEEGETGAASAVGVLEMRMRTSVDVMGCQGPGCCKHRGAAAFVAGTPGHKAILPLGFRWSTAFAIKS